VEIKYHLIEGKVRIAEIVPGKNIIEGAEDILDIMADTRYNESDRIIIHQETLHPDFFILKTGLAGEILQKFSTYRMRLAIVGNFNGLESKSLIDFIRESNRKGVISFVTSTKEAISKLMK
jgi:hypothetical protein